MVEAPEDDAQFRFHLPTPEPLGRPVINIERVSFGYPKREPGASMDDEEGKKKKKKPAEGEGGGEEGKEEGDVVVPPVPVPMLLRPPVEMGKILFENVDFGVDLETRIGKEGGRVRIWCLPKSFGDGASSVFVSKCTLFPPLSRYRRRQWCRQVHPPQPYPRQASSHPRPHLPTSQPAVGVLYAASRGPV